ncbi:MAG TPA: hypothetical protein VL241_02655 [Gemmatimonadales bacterium]|jgi:hypothetical protein|nr:hypothetical protein [Gemmatimonadales bacterium]
MTFAALLLALALSSPADIRALPDTARAPKPPPLAPSVDRRKPQPPPKGKPVGEPQLKRRKPPTELIRIR